MPRRPPEAPFPEERSIFGPRKSAESLEPGSTLFVPPGIPTGLTCLSREDTP